MRTVSASVLKEMLAPQTGHVIISLIKVNHSTLSTPLYFASDYNNVVFNTQTYTAFPFQLALPDDTEETVPAVKMILDNVGQDLVDLIRNASDPPTIELYVVDKDPTGTVTALVGPLNFNVSGVSYTMSTIEMTLGYEADFLNASAVNDFFDPTNAPGLF